MTHLQTEELYDYLEGKLGESDRVRVVAHLETGCSRCQAALSEADRLLRALALPLAEPSRRAMVQAAALFDRPESPGAVQQWVERWMAVLVSDSRLQPALTARGGAGDEFRVVYHVPEAGSERNIDLLGTREVSGWSLWGQLEPEDLHGGRLWLLKLESQEAHEMDVDSFGEFHAAYVAPGNWRLECRHHGSVRWETPTLTLEAPAGG